MTAVPSAPSDEKRVEEEVAYPILLAETIRKSISQSSSFKSECSEISSRVDRISHMLRTAVRFATSSSTSIYSPPIRRISSDVARNLERALSLVRKCRRRSFLRRLLNLLTAADFRRVILLLDASVADMQWLLSVFHCDFGDGGVGRERTIWTGIVLSLPPIASNDPMLSWVWSFTAAVQMGPLPDRIEAANELASLAHDNDRTKKIIVDEGGVPPLLRLLKESASVEAQIAAAGALYSVANVEERVRVIVDQAGVPLIVKVLSEAPMRVQIRMVDLVARMAEFDDVAKEDFARENVIGPLVSLLSFEIFDDEVFDSRKFGNGYGYGNGRSSFHSVVRISNEREGKQVGVKPKEMSVKARTERLNSYSSVSSKYSDGGGSHRGGQTRRERENESAEVKKELKVSCSRALWMLAKDSVSNSRRITETKGLLCLAKLIEKEDGELQMNCLMTIMDITLAAESSSDLRRSAFKTNSPAAKAVVDQLLRVINESGNPVLQIPAISSIGSLSRTFPARETRVIGPLVAQLSHKDHEVATEAAIALGKFVCPDNFLCQEHAKSIVEFNAVIPVMRLLREGDRAQLHGLILLCYLAIHASNHEAIEQARVLTALQGADRTVAAQHPLLRELIAQAIRHLDIFGGDFHPLRQSSLRL